MLAALPVCVKWILPAQPSSFFFVIGNDTGGNFAVKFLFPCQVAIEI